MNYGNMENEVNVFFKQILDFEDTTKELDCKEFKPINKAFIKSEQDNKGT